jgi:hypothetical protein
MEDSQLKTSDFGLLPRRLEKLVLQAVETEYDFSSHDTRDWLHLPRTLTYLRLKLPYSEPASSSLIENLPSSLTYLNFASSIRPEVYQAVKSNLTQLQGLCIQNELEPDWTLDTPVTIHLRHIPRIVPSFDYDHDYSSFWTYNSEAEAWQKVPFEDRFQP